MDRCDSIAFITHSADIRQILDHIGAESEPPRIPLVKDDLFAYVREHLAAHKAPRHWFKVDGFPLTGSGEIQKFRLREMCAKGELLVL